MAMPFGETHLVRNPRTQHNFYTNASPGQANNPFSSFMSGLADLIPKQQSSALLGYCWQAKQRKAAACVPGFGLRLGGLPSETLAQIPRPPGPIRQTEACTPFHSG